MELQKVEDVGGLLGEMEDEELSILIEEFLDDEDMKMARLVGWDQSFSLQQIQDKIKQKSEKYIRTFQVRCYHGDVYLIK